MLGRTPGFYQEIKAADIQNADTLGSPQLPTTVKAIGLDLDGTMMPSYKTLKAIDHAHRSLMSPKDGPGLSSEDANKFISDYLNMHSFQTLLHRPEQTLKALDQFLKDRKVSLSSTVYDAIKSMQTEAFTAYPGLKEALLLAKNAGVPTFIFTNSPDFFAVRRLVTAGIDPEEHGIVALWAKQHKKFAPLSWLNPRSTEAEKKWAEAVIPYTYQKPSDQPLREFSAHAGIKPHEILFIGEGSKDVQSAFCDPANPAAAFCLQVPGARDICRVQQETNERLRPGAEPLGIDAVERTIKELGLGSTSIRRLERGFPQLCEWIKADNIILSPPLRVPYVSDRQLTADMPMDRDLLAKTVRVAGVAAPGYRPGETQ